VPQPLQLAEYVCALGSDLMPDVTNVLDCSLSISVVETNVESAGSQAGVTGNAVAKDSRAVAVGALC